ncbi:MAG: TauD/TfdA dioxygenase family protein, partial [Bacteriovoracia bacterium]
MHILKSQVFKDSDLIELAASLSSVRGNLKDKILHWDFGPIMTMSYHKDAGNYLFSDEKVPFHWDGAFYREPRLLLFYCTESEGEGGETLFTNTEKIWDSLSGSEKSICSRITLTYRTSKVAHYGGEIKIPLVQKHPETNKTILRMAEKVETDLNPVELYIEGIEDSGKFYDEMIRKLYLPEFAYVHRWEKGDLIICDNFTFLHGRNELGQ